MEYNAPKMPDEMLYQASTRPTGGAFTPGKSPTVNAPTSQGGGAVIGGGMFGASWGTSSMLDTGFKGIYGGR